MKPSEIEALLKSCLKPFIFKPLTPELLEKIRHNLESALKHVTGEPTLRIVDSQVDPDDPLKMIVTVRGPRELIEKMKGETGSVSDDYRLRFELPDGTLWEGP